MNYNDQKFNVIYFYLTIAGVFFIIISRSFLSDGMFMDGTMYATISKNMANGLGTFWSPHFTDTFFPTFTQHPPLALGLESLFFRVFGESRFVERFYSVIAISAVALIIVSIWKSIGKELQTAWLPLFFWILFPTVTWASVNNVLENTLSIFVSLSVLFYLRSHKSYRFLFVILSGIMLSLGFLTKGFVTFFPLSFPFFYWLFLRENRFTKMVVDTILLIVSALLPLLLLYIFTGANYFFKEYFGIALNMITSEVTKKSRFYIIYGLFIDLLPGLILTAFFMIYFLIRKIPFPKLTSNIRPLLLFLSIGLSAVLPILLTKKQSTFYLLPGLSFFAIFFSLILSPLIETLNGIIDLRPNIIRFLKFISVLIFSIGIFLSIFLSGSINRDVDMIQDLRKILPEIPPNCTISILPAMNNNYSLHTYIGRCKNISLDANPDSRHEYILVKNSFASDTLRNSFERIELKTNDLTLFRRKIDRTPEK